MLKLKPFTQQTRMASLEVLFALPPRMIEGSPWRGVRPSISLAPRRRAAMIHLIGVVSCRMEEEAEPGGFHRIELYVLAGFSSRPSIRNVAREGAEHGAVLGRDVIQIVRAVQPAWRPVLFLDRRSQDCRGCGG